MTDKYMFVLGLLYSMYNSKGITYIVDDESNISSATSVAIDP